MFGSGRKTQKVAHHVDTWIGPEVTIRGDVLFSGGLHVEGRVIGSVIAEPGSESVLTVSERGSIEGEVRVPQVIIDGTLKGDVVASERVELAARARIEGNIYYKVVQMAAGATVTGQLVHGAEPPKSLPAPEGLAASKA
ncbi:MAG: cell shape determination protein CcmA [Lysobacterales bacterium]|nr:MAG: cell shape determination protein CcmA [Xanthomonadales bacterium]